MKTSAQSLVLFPGGLGDFLCFLPALQYGLLSRTGSERGVALAVRGSAFELATSLAGLRLVYLLDRGVFASLFSLSSGDRQQADHFFSSFHSVFSWFGHSHMQVQANLKRHSRDVYSFPFFVGQEPSHACRYYLDCVGLPEVRCPSLPLRPQDRAAGEEYWRTMGWSSRTQVLLMHPGSGGRRKRWDPAGFSAVAQWWKHSRQARNVIVLLGPAEETERQRWQTVGHVVHGYPVWSVAALLGRASLYLGNDSGVSHLAGSLGARGGVIFGPTRPEQWKPLGGSLSVIHNGPCRQTSPDAEGISLSELPVEQVIATLWRAV